MSEQNAGKKGAPANQQTALLGWQEELWKGWQTAWQKGMEQWQKMLEQGKKEFPGADLFQSWQEMVFKQFQELSKAQPAGLGAEVFSRALNAGAIYTKVLDFWKNAFASFLEMEGDKSDPEALRKLQDQWIDQYQDLLKSLWGVEPSGIQKEALDSWAKILKTQTDAYWEAITPVIKNLEQLPEKLQASAKGESQGIIELYALLRKNYEDTFGKVLRVPTMGYFREIQERVNKSIDSYVEYVATSSQYYSLLYQTGIRGMEKVISRLEEYKDKDWTSPDAAKEFYRLWWTINEDTYHELFLSPEFINLLREVLTRGLNLRKFMDELYDKLVESTPLPSKKDMDEIYLAIYELKKEVRWQRRAINELRGKSSSEPEKEEV